jgi:hypothetical protein
MVARLVNSFAPMHFSVFIHLNIESRPAVKESVGGRRLDARVRDAVSILLGTVEALPCWR